MMYFERETLNGMSFDFLSPVTSALSVGTGIWMQKQQEEKIKEERKKAEIAAREAAIAQRRAEAALAAQQIQAGAVEEVSTKSKQIKYALIAVGTVAAVIASVFVIGTIRKKK